MDEFRVKGYLSRHLFAHDIYCLPKCGPDGYKLAIRMAGDDRLEHQWQILLYADSDLVEQFPRGLFFDGDVMWHRQHLGLPGQVASATVLIDGAQATSMVHQSDLVQRISRERKHKTRIENRFKGWPRLLLNAIATFAARSGARALRTPTAELALLHTDRSRDVQRALFDRVYDEPISYFSATRDGEWWLIDLERNRERLVAPDRVEMDDPEPAAVCVTHDLERGLGHLDVDLRFAREADAAATRNLSAMLGAERQAGIRVTYNVVGCILDEVREQLEADGHCLAFHSYDHQSGASGAPWRGHPVDHLTKCREIDYRLKGYRAPRSVLTDDLSPERLTFHNFEWLASSGYSLGTFEPRVENRVAYLPVTIDDFALHTGELTYAQWEKVVLDKVTNQSFTCVSLHDCYAPTWLDRYPRLLELLSDRATLRTLDEVAASHYLTSSV